MSDFDSMTRRLFIVEEIVPEGVESPRQLEKYAVVKDSTDAKWLIIRQRPEEGGHSPLVGTADTLEEVFTELGKLI